MARVISQRDRRAVLCPNTAMCAEDQATDLLATKRSPEPTPFQRSESIRIDFLRTLRAASPTLSEVSLRGHAHVFARRRSWDRLNQQ